MTSMAKLLANRRNAARSTGPRTAAGKLRASRNALRHGLSIGIEKHDAAKIEELAEQYVAMFDAHPEAARSAAAARLELFRVTQLRLELLNTSLQNASAYDGLGSEGRASLALADALPAMVPLDRYQRRALSRCKQAFRAMMPHRPHRDEREEIKFAKMWRRLYMRVSRWK